MLYFYNVFIIKAKHRKTQTLIGQCTFFYDFWDACSRKREVPYELQTRSANDSGTNFNRAHTYCVVGAINPTGTAGNWGNTDVVCRVLSCFIVAIGLLSSLAAEPTAALHWRRGRGHGGNGTQVFALFSQFGETRCFNATINVFWLFRLFYNCTRTGLISLRPF